MSFFVHKAGWLAGWLAGWPAGGLVGRQAFATPIVGALVQDVALHVRFTQVLISVGAFN